MTAHIRWPLVLDDMEAEVTGDPPPLLLEHDPFGLADWVLTDITRMAIIGDAPWLYDPRNFPGFTEEQIRAGLTVPATEEKP